AWESTAGSGPPFFCSLSIRGDGQVDQPRGLRWDAVSCRPGAAFPAAGTPLRAGPGEPRSGVLPSRGACPGRDDAASEARVQTLCPARHLSRLGEEPAFVRVAGSLPRKAGEGWEAKARA